MLNNLWRWRGHVAAAVLVCLTGCATQPRALYEWGNYESVVYDYLKGTGVAPQDQIGSLQQTMQQAAASGLKLPPGFNAQLGLLYLKAGQPGQAQAAFRAEEVQFPESRPYMEFLLAKMDQHQGGN